MFTLRPYQEKAVKEVYQHLRQRDDNPVVVIPTGGGKTPVITTICMDAVEKWKGRVLIIAHVKELLKQSVDHLNRFIEGNKVGVYSAGLKRRDTDHPVIVAGIQSIYKRACDLDAFNLVIIDEAHMIPPEGDGMYRQFLADAAVINPNIRVIGFTATPFRMKSGSICSPEYFLNAVCYEIGVRELIVDGYLSPLKTKSGKNKVDTSGLKIVGGEFNSGETEALMDQDNLVEAACQEIIEYTHDRKACLVFSSGVAHGKHIEKVLANNHGQQVGTVFGDTPPLLRDQTLEEFRNGHLKYLVNMNVLTMGFDAPNIDSIAIVRPTLSPGLYYQMVGRGFRLCEDKEDCLVLDFGGNVKRHGPVDSITIHEPGSNSNREAPTKECPYCREVVAAGFIACPDCGHEFPPREKTRHAPKATSAGILSQDITTTKYPVQAVNFSVHTKHGAPDDAPKTMRVDYQIGRQQHQSEWICFDHSGWAKKRAESWWWQRSNAPVPISVAEAVDMANGGALCETKTITVRSAAGEKYDHIVGYDLGEKPFYREPGWDEEEDEYAPVEAREGINGNDVPF